MKLPAIKNWIEDLEKVIEGKSQSKQDMLSVIRACYSVLEELNRTYDYVSSHKAHVEQLRREYENLYFSRFGQQAPPPAEKTVSKAVIEDTDEKRLLVRKLALALTPPPHAEITAKRVLEELESQKYEIVATNKLATISTILNGFKTHFEKVRGKKGVFRRLDISEN